MAEAGDRPRWRSSASFSRATGCDSRDALAHRLLAPERARASAPPPPWLRSAAGDVSNHHCLSAALPGVARGVEASHARFAGPLVRRKPGRCLDAGVSSAVGGKVGPAAGRAMDVRCRRRGGRWSMALRSEETPPVSDSSRRSLEAFDGPDANASAPNARSPPPAESTHLRKQSASRQQAASVPLGRRLLELQLRRRSAQPVRLSGETLGMPLLADPIADQRRAGKPPRPSPSTGRRARARAARSMLPSSPDKVDRAPSPRTRTDRKRSHPVEQASLRSSDGGEHRARLGEEALRQLGNACACLCPRSR